MKRLKHIDLVFENCESARLKPSMFRNLMLNSITRSWHIGFDPYGREVSEHLCCRSFSIVIKAVGLEKAQLRPSFLSAKTLRERLARWKDIVAVHLYFRDGMDECIYPCAVVKVPWSGEHDTNTLQRHKKPHKWFQEPDGLVIEAKESA